MSHVLVCMFHSFAVWIKACSVVGVGHLMTISQLVKEVVSYIFIVALRLTLLSDILILVTQARLCYQDHCNLISTGNLSYRYLEFVIAYA